MKIEYFLQHRHVHLKLTVTKCYYDPGLLLGPILLKSTQQ